MSATARDLDLEGVTPVNLFNRNLQELIDLEGIQTEEQEDKVRLAVYFILAYLAYLLVSYVILRCVSKFDLILGLVRFMRKSNPTVCCMNTTIIVYLLYFFLCPMIIALAWSLAFYKNSEDNDGVIAGAIFLMLMFSTFIILGALIWYGNKWYVSKVVIVFFGLGTFSAWLFTLTVSMTGDSYTYSGVSAILLSTNFIPACSILYKKTVWKDVPIYALFKMLAYKISSTTEADRAKLLDMTPVQKRDEQEFKMQETLTCIVEEENKYLKTRMALAFLFYLVTFGAYLGVFLYKESDATLRGLALLNPLFIFASDIVIMSLRQQTVKIRKESQQSFIYSNAFQGFILLFNRVLLCYNK
jgi:hypothetical protein